MGNAPIPNVPLTQPKRKSYFPFQFGMRSQPDQGVGAFDAINAQCNKDGHVEKTKGIELIKEILGVPNLSSLFDYQKSDGSVVKCAIYRVAVSGADPDFFVMRVVETDLSITSPTGPEESLTGVVTFTNGSDAVSATGGKFLSEVAVGDWVYSTGDAANAAQVASITDDDNLVLETNYGGATASAAGKRASVHFEGEQFDHEEIGGVRFVSNNSDNTPLYSFDGTALTAIANVSEAILSIAADANRLAAAFKDRVEFSGDDISTSNDYKSGTGVNRFGQYGTSISYPKAVCKGGDGILIFGSVNAEAHQVIPNAASDDVSSKTKNPAFTHNGPGVDHPRQCISGSYFTYFANEDGVYEMNPYSGAVKKLTDVGAARNLWDDLKKGSVLIGHDPSNDFIVVVAQKYGQNDTMLCFDTSQKQRPCWYSESQYYSCLATIDGSLFGGSSRDGKIYKLFSGSTDFGGSQQTFRYRFEKDGLGGVPFLKTFRKFVVYNEMHPRSTFTARVYLDDETEPVFEKSFGTTNAVKKAGTNEVYGMYQFRIGEALKDELSNHIRLSQKNSRFNRVSIEIEERSARKFKLKDIIIEYKSRGRFVRKFLSKDVS